MKKRNLNPQNLSDNKLRSSWDTIKHNYEFLILSIPCIGMVLGEMPQFKQNIFSGNVSVKLFLIAPVLCCLLITTVKNRKDMFSDIAVRCSLVGGACTAACFASYTLAVVLRLIDDNGATAWLFLMGPIIIVLSSLLTLLAGFILWSAINLIARVFGRLPVQKPSNK